MYITAFTGKRIARLLPRLLRAATPSATKPQLQHERLQHVTSVQHARVAMQARKASLHWVPGSLTKSCFRVIFTYWARVHEMRFIDHRLQQTFVISY